MSKIQKVNKQTENKFLNLYDLEAKDRMGGDIHYYVSSRAKTPDDLKINTRNEKPDAQFLAYLRILMDKVGSILANSSAWMNPLGKSFFNKFITVFSQ